MRSNLKLDTVTKAKQAYIVAKATMEQKIRESFATELNQLQTQLDIAVRYAYDSGESKASILRALGTKDYHTLNAHLQRTNTVSEIVGEDPLDNVYRVDGDTLFVTYDKHGISEYSGQASFVIKKLTDGSYLFLSNDSLWNEDFTVRNDVVAALDGKSDGFYYDEVVEWLTQKS